MRILGFGTYEATRHPRIQVLLDGLRERGEEVVEVNRPLGFTTAERVDMLRRPHTAWRMAVRLSLRWFQLAGAGRRAARSLDPDVVLVGYLGHFDVLLARLVLRRRVIALDHLIFAADTAADRGVAGASLKSRLLVLLDRLALRAAHIVIVDTDEHAALVPAPLRDRVVVAAVGAPDAWFTPIRPTAPDGPLTVLFFGLFTPLQGTVVIGQALARLGDDVDIRVTMVGSGQDLAACRAAAGDRPHVEWLDWVAPDELPALAAAHDVCLGIFADTPKALRVVPNKVYQGAAAGCAVITSDTGPQRRTLGSDAVFVPPADPDALAGALRGLATDRARLAELRERVRSRAEAQFRPSAVVGPLRARLAATRLR